MQNADYCHIPMNEISHQRLCICSQFQSFEMPTWAANFELSLCGPCSTRLDLHEYELKHDGLKFCFAVFDRATLLVRAHTDQNASANCWRNKHKKVLLSKTSATSTKKVLRPKSEHANKSKRNKLHFYLHFYKLYKL